MTDVRVLPDSRALAEAAVGLFVSLARDAIASRGRFTVALSGGATPQGMYRLLATPEFVRQTDWGNIHLLWGDERCVPPDHPDSNFGQAKKDLLAHVPIPAAQVHRMRGEIAPEAAASEYEQVLHCFLPGPGEAPSGSLHSRLDLILLGMGADGHTASLFPGAAALQEGARWVVGYHVDDAHGWRLTLTPGVINAARTVVFLVSGADKAERVKQALRGPHRPDLLPAQIVQPVDGQCRWLIDSAAASAL